MFVRAAKSFIWSRIYYIELVNMPSQSPDYGLYLNLFFIKHLQLEHWCIRGQSFSECVSD